MIINHMMHLNNHELSKLENVFVHQLDDHETQMNYVLEWWRDLGVQSFLINLTMSFVIFLFVYYIHSCIDYVDEFMLKS